MTEKAGTGVAVLDEAVLEALGQLQGKYDAEFVARMITMFMETALILLIRLKEAITNRDIIALHHASHELKSDQSSGRILMHGGDVCWGARLMEVKVIRRSVKQRLWSS